MSTLIDSLSLSYSALRGFLSFNSLDRNLKRFVFYAETAADWGFLDPVVQFLIKNNQSVIRLTSDPRDPFLSDNKTFFIGDGSLRTILFRTIDADAFLMTLSDLDTFYLKRSSHDVHYFYFFHSMASTHRVYREHAFDAYDTIFAVGPHHVKEIRSIEKKYDLKKKNIIPHGYPRLDSLLKAISQADAPDKNKAFPTVLLAPSWGDCSIVKHCLDEIIKTLISSNMHVTLRLHPMTVRHFPLLAGQLIARYESTGLFEFDEFISATESLVNSDLMISEWSGAALEFAFSRLRPVIFIDTPAKINNEKYELIGHPCFEDYVRSDIGIIVGLAQIADLPVQINDLVQNSAEWSERILKIREEYIYNVGNSADAAGKYLIDWIESL